jgi:twitching motility protein PilT
MKPIQELLIDAKSRNASDLLIMVGDCPAMRVAGCWIRCDTPICTDEYLTSVTKGMLRPDAWDELQRKREFDLSCNFPATGRVRCNVHFQRDHLSMVLRLVWPEIPEPKKLGIPPHVISAGELNHGLILVSGPTGCGKSTTLAAMVEHINKTRAAHIITIEDPIEFMYTNKKAIIEQREIGSDTPSWHSALRTVLRQAPDVILLGELRDLESISIALSAAETGHLVMASVHASTAAGAISRIADAFPASQSAQVRLQLSQSLRMVFAQRLVPGKLPESRVLQYEILMSTPAIANMIRANEIEQIPNAIASGRSFGMVSFSQCQRELLEKGMVPSEKALTAAAPAAALAR